MPMVASMSPGVLLAHSQRRRARSASGRAASCCRTTRRSWSRSSSRCSRRCTRAASTWASAGRRAPTRPPRPRCAGPSTAWEKRGLPGGFVDVLKDARRAARVRRAVGGRAAADRRPRRDVDSRAVASGRACSPRASRASLGLPYAYAHHFATGRTAQAAQTYRDAFGPSPLLDALRLMVVGLSSSPTPRRRRSTSRARSFGHDACCAPAARSPWSSRLTRRRGSSPASIPRGRGSSSLSRRARRSRRRRIAPSR